MTSFECTNSVFSVTDENNSFSISILGHWNSEDSEEPINNLNGTLKLKSENGIELHVEEVEKRGTRIDIENSWYNLTGFDHFKRQILSETKRVKNRDLEDMVYRLQLIYHQILDTLDVENITGSTIGYTLPPGEYEIRDIDSMLKSLLPKEVKVNTTIDDNRLKSNLTTKKKQSGLLKNLFSM